MSDNLGAEPRVVQRHCGGWLAYSHPSSRAVRIGVTAETAAGAASRWHVAIDEWRAILENNRDDDLGKVSSPPVTPACHADVI